MQSVTVIPLPVLGRRNVNTFLLCGERTVLVDTGTPGSGPKILARIEAQGLRPRDLAAIVVTHGHIDHFGSAAFLHEATKAPIIAHAGDLETYAQGRVTGPLPPTGPFGWLFRKTPLPHAHTQPFVPHVVLDAPAALHDYGVAAQILPTPGHTPGSISVLTDAGALIAGDLIAGRFLGLLAAPADPPFHDDPARNLASLNAMLDRDPTTLYVGHGAALDAARVRRWARREQHRLVTRGITSPG
ncbi:MBL fold metallo-hydrolase [Nocardia stercoris]|uniref:MBL fold metallo-hydrolase n=1 Tax=Nocardia stercoris TaxID=2483361 RepID=A0A3M2L2P8_9NOCA|nr:MBL fold metallo-hydrolase [Nocardia stercoris]RMI31236.1 MBL fold metallo-hydrolase [Nocardia stercoris]